MSVSETTVQLDRKRVYKAAIIAPLTLPIVSLAIMVLDPFINYYPLPYSYPTPSLLGGISLFIIISSYFKSQILGRPLLILLKKYHALNLKYLFLLGTVLGITWSTLVVWLMGTMSTGNNPFPIILVFTNNNIIARQALIFGPLVSLSFGLIAGIKWNTNAS